MPADTSVIPGCEPLNGPEPLSDIARYNTWMNNRDAAPFGRVDRSAHAAALAQRAAIARAGHPAPGLINAVLGVNNLSAAWQPVGTDALHAADTTYGPSVDGWGNLAGRTTDLAYDPATPGRYFESSNNGGVWETRDSGANWSSIGDNLPSQVIGAIAWSTASGGTLIAGGGDNATGRYSTSGAGIYATSTGGQTWQSATGLPSDFVTFRIAVDPNNPLRVFAATSRGLFLSTDGAASFANVMLPLPDITPNPAGPVGGALYNCTGDTGQDYRCNFANVVTDVVIRTPDAGGAGAGKVLAVLGWKYGKFGYRNELTGVQDATVPQAPQNGVYVSPTGNANSFTFVSAGNTAGSGNGFTLDNLVGRVALGIAHGPGQNHDIVYAVSQDATKLSSGCFDVLDVTTPTCPMTNPQGAVLNTYLDGIYVSANFGTTWTRLADDQVLQTCGNNSTLNRCGALGNLGAGPGYQAWYNEWIMPDPTRTINGAPSRVLFGLEEVWENVTPSPQDGSTGPEDFHVIGRYWNSCTGLALDPIGTPCTGTPPVGSTTHPDQHAAALVPDGAGGVTLLAGGDGGVFIQHTTNLTPFTNQGWCPVGSVGNCSGNNSGLHNLLPYALDVTTDGTVLTGLQDNGTMMISPSGFQQMVYGGDGFFTAIDPGNPMNQLEEYVGGRVATSMDGGHHYKSKDPNTAQAGFNASAQFSTPIQRDPLSAAHVLIGAQYMMETTSAYTNNCSTPQQDPTCPLVSTANDLAHWKTVYDLGAGRSNTANDLSGANAYAGWCSNCYTNVAAPFGSGLSTNVGGTLPPQIGTSDGWHQASAIGLPNRMITSVRMDPSNANTIYVTEGTYLPRWIGADSQGPHPAAGSGHVFKSTDHGDHFTDITGNLPNAPTNWSVVHNGQLVVGTNFGVFVSTDTNGGTYSLLGSGMPAVPVFQMMLQPGNPDVLYAATFGRGVYKYDFNGPTPTIPEFPRGAILLAPLLAAMFAFAIRRRQRQLAQQRRLT